MDNKKARGLNGAVFLVFVIFLFAALWFTNQFDQREKEITWKNFQQLVQNDKIESVEVNQNKSVPTGRVEITLKGDDDSDKIRYLYVSDVNEIQDYLKEQNVEYTMPDIPQDSWAATTFLPVILTLGGVFLLFGLMNRQGGGANSKAMNFGKSRARLSTDRDKGRCYDSFTLCLIHLLLDEFQSSIFSCQMNPDGTAACGRKHSDHSPYKKPC